jgi:hypothetical protein
VVYEGIKLIGPEGNGPSSEFDGHKSGGQKENVFHPDDPWGLNAAFNFYVSLFFYTRNNCQNYL